MNQNLWGLLFSIDHIVGRQIETGVSLTRAAKHTISFFTLS